MTSVNCYSLYNCYANREVFVDYELDLRKSMLNGRKSERIIFAVTPELKEAVAKAAENKCVSVSSYITTLLADEIISKETSVN